MLTLIVSAACYPLHYTTATPTQKESNSQTDLYFVILSSKQVLVSLTNYFFQCNGGWKEGINARKSTAKCLVKLNRLERIKK